MGSGWFFSDLVIAPDVSSYVGRDFGVSMARHLAVREQASQAVRWSHASGERKFL
jgi:hypothetical protein